MSRPLKLRSVANKPYCAHFKPLKSSKKRKILLSLDEYETIRLIDHERLSQENCAKVMDVSRTTVQRIYALARQKLAQAIVEGIAVEIEGGSIHLSEKKTQEPMHEQGEVNMKLAIGIDGLQVAGHFGNCNDFRIVTVENNIIMGHEDIHDETHVHHDRPQFLKDLGVDTLIMNSMGKAAYNRLLALNIECVAAENRSIEEALAAYLSKAMNKKLEGHECNNCGGHEHHGDHPHHG